MGRATRILMIAAILALCYTAKLPIIVLVVAVMLALVLDWPVERLHHMGVPRQLSGALVVVLVMGSAGLVSYAGYDRATSFLNQAPKYSQEIRSFWNTLNRRARQLEKTAESVMPPEHPPTTTVRIAEPSGLETMTRSVGSVSELALAVSFIPFLTYFMLSWKPHLRDRTIALFPPAQRPSAQDSLNRIVEVVRRFVLGNLLSAFIIGGISTLVFGVVGVPFFYFVGFISGALSLIPYLGMVLAPLPPLVVGLGHIHSTELLIVLATTVGLHLVALNVLYPKLVGGQLQINPLAGTLALLFWGWLWGPIGLILGVPITAAIKIVCDQVDSLRPYGAWLGIPDEKAR
jgi:predicted PurR-regulated permease PerM